ncbi:ABC transporter substrate-binding protein [Flavobacteriales bacterium]|nr:ABC transporter substrate-binding protein [Flavobacteriales bacterium]
MKLILNLLGCLAIAGIMSCGNVNTKAEQEGLTAFRYNEPGGITSLDPAFAKNLENIWPVHQVFNGLVQMDEHTEVVPCIASKWEISEDGREYTFTIRNDVYFHDHDRFENGKGRKVTAHDFEYSFYRIIDEDVASPGRSIFNVLEKSERSHYKGFYAVDDRTFKVFLAQPFPPFLGLLTMDYCSVVPKEIVEYYGNDFRRNPIGTGPFKFKRWIEGEKLNLLKNDNYFETDGDNKLPYLDAISVSFVKDPQVAFLDFIRGNFDFKSGLDGSFKDEILTENGDLKGEYESKFRMEKQPWLETVYFGILVDESLENVQLSPLKEKAIRKAINYAIDRDKLVKYLRNNIGVPAHSGFVPRGIASFDAEKVKGYQYNVEKAKELLYVAGFPDGKGLPQIKLRTTKLYEQLNIFVQHELEEIGIPAEIEVFEEGYYRGMVDNSGANFFTKSWIADYPDAENFLMLYYSENHSPKGFNYTHFSNYDFDKLYNMAMGEVNDSLRYSYYQEMDKILIEEAPVVPLYYNEVVRFVHNNIEGLETNSMNTLSLKRVRKVKAEE